MKKLICLIPLYSSSLFAKDIKGSIKSLESGLKTDVALPIAIICFVIVGLYFMAGRKDAAERFSSAIVGLALILLSTAIVSFFQGKVG